MSTNHPKRFSLTLSILIVIVSPALISSTSNPLPSNQPSQPLKPEVHQYLNHPLQSSEDLDPRGEPIQSSSQIQAPVQRQQNNNNVQSSFSHRVNVVPIPYSPFNPSSFNGPSPSYGGQSSPYGPSSSYGPSPFTGPSINSIAPKPSQRVFTTPMIEPVINPYLAQLLSSYSMSSPQVVETVPSAYYSGLVKDPSLIKIPYFSPSFIPGPSKDKKSNFLRRILFNSDSTVADEEEDEGKVKKSSGGFFQRRKGNSFLRGPLKWFFVRRDNEDEEAEASGGNEESESDGNSLQTIRGNIFKGTGSNHHPLGPEFDSLGPGTFLNYNGELMFIPVGSMQTFRSLNQMSQRNLGNVMPQYLSYQGQPSDLMATSESLLSTLWKMIKK